MSTDERVSTIQLTDVATADFLDWDPNQEAYCDAVALSSSVETVRGPTCAHPCPKNLAVLTNSTFVSSIVQDPALEADFLETPGINEKTDVYALADMIFTMLTGTEGAAIVQQELRAALRYRSSQA
jgi:hypothetical protein